MDKMKYVFLLLVVFQVVSCTVLPPLDNHSTFHEIDFTVSKLSTESHLAAAASHEQLKTSILDTTGPDSRVPFASSDPEQREVNIADALTAFEGFTNDVGKDAVKDANEKGDDKNGDSIEEKFTTVTAEFEPASEASADGQEIDTASTVASPEQPLGPFIIPEPFERYANKIYMEGHLHHREPDMTRSLDRALWHSRHFQRVDPLRVNVVRTNFINAQNGDRVTEVQYVVSYNGQVLENYVVGNVIRSSEASKYLQTDLDNQNIRQYAPYTDVEPVKEKSAWYHKHLPWIIALTCVFTTLLVVLIALTVVLRRRTKKAGKGGKRPQGPCVSADSSSDKRKLFADDGDNVAPPPYTKKPLYKFETNAVMDGFTLP